MRKYFKGADNYDYLFKIGDKVIIRSDLIENQSYISHNGKETNSVTDTMYELRGQICTISEHYKGQYSIKENDYTWIDSMFEEHCLEWVY